MQEAQPPPPIGHARAARAYGELLQEDPNNVQYSTAYFTGCSGVRETLLDRTLLVLWIRGVSTLELDRCTADEPAACACSAAR